MTQTLLRPQDAAGDQVEDVFFVAQDDGVARVIAALRADDDVRVLGEKIDDFAFAFVAPLGPDQDGICHEF